ncbi:MAG TPA: TolC family protein [Leptolyngbyaceae cyanobacterium]
MVFMRDTYRRYLMTLGLGTAIALLPHAQTASAAPDSTSQVSPRLISQASESDNSAEMGTQATSAEANPSTAQTVDSEEVSQTGADAEPATPSASPAATSTDALLPRIDLQRIPSANQIVPLGAAERPQPIAQEETGASLPLDEPTTPSEALDPVVPSATPAEIPAAPTTEVTTVTPPSTPDYLNPQANPLLLPTQPEEVSIIGTQPITLEQAIELAYRNNESLRVAQLELERSQAALRETQADLYPSVDLTAGLTAQEGQSQSINPLTGRATTTSQINTTLSGNAQISYDIYTGGLREANIRAAEERVRLNELEVERQRAQLRLDTTNEYYATQENVENIRIAQAFLVEAERNLQDATLREQVGVGTRFDVLRAEVQVANGRQQLVQAQSNRLVAQRTLARRLNLPPNLTIDTAPVNVAGTWPLSLEESIVLAFQNRAELEQQLVQRNVSEQERIAARSTTLPQVGLVASYDIQNTLNRSTGFTDSFSLGAQVRWNVFDGGAASARAEQRERDIEIAESQFADTRNGVRLEVEQAYFNLTSNQENISTARLAVEQAREALQLAQLRFDAGVGTQLDVLSATRELTEAEANLIQATLGYNRSLAALERAVSNLPEPLISPTSF